MEENIMKLKKLTALTLALSLALSLTACGGGSSLKEGAFPSGGRGRLFFGFPLVFWAGPW